MELRFGKVLPLYKLFFGPHRDCPDEDFARLDIDFSEQNDILKEIGFKS